MRSAILVSALLFALCFTGATLRENMPVSGIRSESTDRGVLIALMGDSRRLFANHFFAKADAYFHSGYYPTIFDQPSKESSSHLTAESVGSHTEHEAAHGSEPNGDHEEGFLKPPLDWIEKFGRNFFASHHSHLQTGNERELLPWLKLSADLDPQKVETYTVASFWLRSKLGKVYEAEQFLREGLRANPNSYEILFELGRIQDENHHDPTKARTLYELALRKWMKQKELGGHPDEFMYEQITGFLARLEEAAGNLEKAVFYLEKVKEVSPAKDILEKQIAELRLKIEAGKLPPKK